MPSEFPGYFPRIHGVEVGQVIQSAQQARQARGINARILSGLGDMHWRCLWAAYSLTRQFRLDDGATPVPLEPAEDEWWQLYGLYKETKWDWPTATAGFPEGLNKDCPIVGYFFGSQDGTSIDDEQTRLGNVPLRDGGAPAPATVLEIWDLGKDQRGGITSADLTDYTYAPAMGAARIMDDANGTIPSLSGYHKTAGGRIQDNDADNLIREKGQQWDQMRQQFLTEWRGTAAQRNDDPDWSITSLAPDYEGMLAGQWFLAPAYGEATGSGGAVVAEYPLFEWDAAAPDDTYGEYDDGVGTYTYYQAHANFALAGVIIVGSNLTDDHTVDVEVGGVVVESLTVTVAEPQISVWWPTPYTAADGQIKFKLRDGLTGSEDVFAEVAELKICIPEIFDVHLFVRMMQARSSTPTIYRGKIVDTAQDISNAYFENGMILNDVVSVIPQETKLAKYAPYQAMRDFLLRWFRIVTYKQLKGYYVNGSGNSVLIFDREGLGDSDADVFQDLCPVVAAIGDNSIRENVWYRVDTSGASPSGYITYDGQNYYEGDTFRGTYATGYDDANATDLTVYEDHFLIDLADIPKGGESNEWIFSILGQVPYKDTTGATYHPDSYGNVYGPFADRCHVFSSSMSSPTGSTAGIAFNKYSGLTSAAQTIVTRTESPPGHRYSGDDVPYWNAGTVNPLISSADGASAADCRQAIFDGGDYDDYSAGDCEGIEAHYESCQVFKAPYQIKSISINASDNTRVDVELTGRLVASDSAPSSILDTSGSRTTYLSTDTGPRTDESTVVAVLKWYVDGGTGDEERIGDISPNANADYNAGDIKGSVLCRFGFQRLMPQTWNDNNANIEPGIDRRAYSDLTQYAEFILRASVGGFVDEQRIEDTLTYNAATEVYHAFCDSQDSRDWTMPNLLTKIGSSDDRIAMRLSGLGQGGYGALPHTKLRADHWTELAECFNELRASRFEVPVYLESRTMTYWDYGTTTIELINGFYVARNVAYVKPTTLQTPGTWAQEFVPFGESASAYMTLWNDGATDRVLFFWKEVQWRMRPHPKVIKAVPETLRAYVDSLGLALPWLYEPPSQVRSVLIRDPLPGDALTDFTALDTISDPTERCEIGQSGTLAPLIPPAGALVAASIGSGPPGGTAGDAESFSHASMHIEQTGETYIRVPVA